MSATMASRPGRGLLTATKTARGRGEEGGDGLAHLTPHAATAHAIPASRVTVILLAHSHAAFSAHTFVRTAVPRACEPGQRLFSLYSNKLGQRVTHRPASPVRIAVCTPPVPRTQSTASGADTPHLRAYTPPGFAHDSLLHLCNRLAAHTHPVFVPQRTSASSTPTYTAESSLPFATSGMLDSRLLLDAPTTPPASCDSERSTNALHAVSRPRLAVLCDSPFSARRSVRLPPTSPHATLALRAQLAPLRAHPARTYVYSPSARPRRAQSAYNLTCSRSPYTRVSAPYAFHIPPRSCTGMMGNGVRRCPHLSPPCGSTRRSQRRGPSRSTRMAFVQGLFAPRMLFPHAPQLHARMHASKSARGIQILWCTQLGSASLRVAARTPTRLCEPWPDVRVRTRAESPRTE
ncbi:hypothetical protein C8R44DRAFT_740055 [Mycena epipterygia]|nr:hypothetical protein C8R44DRAFT_740055 [Mycena epipterygia]